MRRKCPQFQRGWHGNAQGRALRRQIGLRHPRTPADKVLARLSSAGTLVDITISDPPLEEVIAMIYKILARHA
jgi:hypothetical protein